LNLFVSSLILLIDGGSVGEFSRISLDELNGGLEVIVGGGRRSPSSDSEEVKAERGGGSRVDRHSHDESVSSISIVRNVISPVINVSWGPVGSS